MLPRKIYICWALHKIRWKVVFYGHKSFASREVEKGHETVPTVVVYLEQLIEPDKF